MFKNFSSIFAGDIAIDLALKEATNIPFQTLTFCREIMSLSLEVALSGSSNSISDAGVAGEMAHAGAHGAALNVLINLRQIYDSKFLPTDESKLFFIGRTLQDYAIGLYSINADGTNQTQLTTYGAAQDQVIAWSPDGSKIAFS